MTIRGMDVFQKSKTHARKGISMNDPRFSAAPRMYLQMAEGPDDLLGPRMSRGRVAAAAVIALALAFLILFVRMPGIDSGPLKDNLAIASSGSAKDADSEDDSGPGGDGDDDDSVGTNTPGTTRGDGTRGQTGHRADVKTGAESQGNTDRPGADTGASTRGETDPGDKTGKTEQR